MNIKTILTSLIIASISATTVTAHAHSSSSHYDNHSVTQYTLNKRKNERYIEQLENKVNRLEHLLEVADQFIERYVLSNERPTHSYGNKPINHHSRDTYVHACSMPIHNKSSTLIKINTNKDAAKSDLIQQCRHKGYRQCSTKRITCDSTRVSTGYNHSYR